MMMDRLRVLPDTDGEEVLLQLQPYDDEDDPAPAGLSSDALEAAEVVGHFAVGGVGENPELVRHHWVLPPSGRWPGSYGARWVRHSGAPSGEPEVLDG